jgi:hypothetical protein
MNIKFRFKRPGIWLSTVFLVFFAYIATGSFKNDRSKYSLKLPAINYIPFKPGEKLTFNLHYGMINAGEATFEILDEEKKITGRDHFQVKIKGHSNPFFDPFYKVRDNYESFIDSKTIFPTIFSRDVQEGKFTKKENYIFIRSKNEVVSGTKTYAVPSDIHDLVSTFYYLRCIDFSRQKPGTAFPVTAFFDDNYLQTGIRYQGKETITTSLGKMRCYVFKPILVKGRIFKNQDDMTLYVSEDRNQIPVRIQSKVYLDYVKADLEKYQNLKYPLAALVK